MGYKFNPFTGNFDTIGDFFPYYSEFSAVPETINNYFLGDEENGILYLFFMGQQITLFRRQEDIPLADGMPIGMLLSLTYTGI